MSAADSSLHFLGLDVEGGTPFYGRASVPEAEPSRVRPLRAGLSGSRLEEAGWGVIFPRAIDPKIVKALEPLLKQRREEAGDLYKELTYMPREGPGHFLSRLRAGPGPVAPHRVPYYLLIVGDAAEIPLGFQFDLAVQYAVGRLHLPTPEAYGSYARSVLAAESGARKREIPLELFTVGHDHDMATEIARQEMVGPLQRNILERFDDFPMERVDGALATKERLGRLLDGGASSIVFSVGHAALFRPSSERLHPCQGAIVCADWPGEGPATSRHYFAASDLGPEADLTGRLCVLFGCHTAGTPRLDTFGDPGRGSRRHRRQLAEAPFFSRLPQALLGHPAGGVLAVIAHIDRAYPNHIFGDHSDGQSSVLEDVLYKLLREEPVGLAMESFALRHAELAARLVAQTLEAGDGDFDPLDRQSLWTAYADARSHIILGDPAVRLPDQRLRERGFG